MVTYGGPGQAGNVRKKKWTKESLIRLQAALNLSDRGIKKFAAATRVVFGRDSVDVGLSSFLVEKNKELKDLFAVKWVKMKRKVKLNKMDEENEENIDDDPNEGNDVEPGFEVVERPVVYCTNLDEFLMKVIRERRPNPGEDEVITGMDNGQGFLKVAMVVIDAKEDENKQEGGRAKYSEGVCSKMFKSNSVKQLLMLSVAPNVPENWFNLSSMLNLLDMESLEDATGDLKIYNLLVRKSSDQPNYGYTYCDSGKPFDLEPYNLLELKTI